MAKKKTEKRTHVALVLDESGSMASMHGAAVELFNNQAATIRENAKKAGRTRVSLFKFGGYQPNETVEVFHDAEAEKVPTLENKDFHPQNGTPMRDGIGRAITRLEAEDDGGEDTAFLVIVVTDGQENASKEWSAARLREKVSELEKTGRWTFSVFGANVSLADLHETVGFDASSLPSSNFAHYVGNAAGMRAGSLTMNASTASYMGSRGAGVTASKSFVADEDEKTAN